MLEEYFAEVQSQKAMIEALTKEVSALKSQVNSPKPINLDSEKVAKHLMPHIPHIENSLQSIQTKMQELTAVVSKIPKEINNKEEWGINLGTKVWMSVVFFSLVCGFWLAPKAVQKAEYEATKFRLERKEQQIQDFKNKNPKLGDKYFGF
jgi:hypothetical protein